MDLEFDKNPFEVTRTQSKPRCSTHTDFIRSLEEKGYHGISEGVSYILKYAKSKQQKNDEAFQIATATIFFVLEKIKRDNPDKLDQPKYIYKYLWMEVKRALLKEHRTRMAMIEIPQDFVLPADETTGDNERVREFYEKAWAYIYSTLSVQEAFILSRLYGTDKLPLKELKVQYEERFNTHIRKTVLGNLSRELKRYAKTELKALYNNWKNTGEI